MPYRISKINNKNCWNVINVDTGKVHSKCTTLENAKKQVRLLNAIDHGFIPKKKSRIRK